MTTVSRKTSPNSPNRPSRKLACVLLNKSPCLPLSLGACKGRCRALTWIRKDCRKRQQQGVQDGTNDC